MKTYLSILIALSLATFISCQPQSQQSPENYQQEEKQKIAEVTKLWLKAWQNEDLDSVPFFLDDDFMNMFYFELFSNKEQSRTDFPSVFDTYSIEDVEYKTIEIIVDQNYAFETQLFKQKWITNDKQDTTYFDMRVIHIFKKQDDGSWRLFREIGQHNQNS